MNDEACVVEVNGSDFYCPCNVVDYLVVVDNRLINTYNSNITLYSEFPDPNTIGSGYPRISANSNQMATYRSSQQATSITLAVNSFDVVNKHNSYDVLLLIVLIGVTVLNLFKR